MEPKTTYEVYIFCGNCHYHGKIEINKGSPIEQSPCPNCGNLTLRIDPNGATFDPANKREPDNYR